jgi:secondary thiamine-phosphate synthase enzyme
MIYQESFTVTTHGRGSYEITDKVQEIVAKHDVDIGLCQVFIHHTSASLMLCENADPQVRRDLDVFMNHLVPDGDPMFRHTTEGPDDMPAHVRTVLTQTDLNIPVKGGRCVLGTWQGIYVWEHRTHQQQRRVTVSVLAN